MRKRIAMLVCLLVCILLAQTAYAVPNPASEFAYVEFDDHVKILGYEGTNPIVEVPATIGGKPVTFVRLGKTDKEATNCFLGVRKIILPSTVKELGDSAFGYYQQLESIEGLEYIERITGDNIFDYCGVNEAHFSNRLQVVVTGAFSNSWNLLRVTLPDDAVYEQRSLRLLGVQELTLLRGDGEATIKLVDGAVYSADGTWLKAVLPLSKSTYYTVADGTESIEIGAFSNAMFMEEVEIPASVNQIHNDGGGLYMLDHDVTVYVHKDSYAHTFFLDYMEQYPSDADNLILCVMEEDDSASVTERVEEILAETITDGMSDIQKARALHDWLCENGSYDYTLTRFSASDILMGGSGVCDAYTRAYCVLLDAAGIESRRVSCYLSNTAHAVNAIRIGGDWIYVDVTNDDEGFGRPADLFGFNDDIYKAFYAGETGVTADTLAYYAPYAAGELDTQLNLLAGRIQAKLDSGVTGFTVALDTAADQIRAEALCSLLEERQWLYGGVYYAMDCTVESDGSYSCLLTGVAERPEFSFYTNERGCLTITGYNGSAASVEIPASIDGVQVDALQGAFSSNRTVQSVTLPEGMVAIGEKSFWDCTALETINFPVTLVTIGDSAFGGCISLKTDLVFASGLKEVGMLAFSMCYCVEKASLPGTVESIGNGAFDQCSNLRTVTLGEGITRLPKLMFYRCLSLRSLTLPDSLIALEEGVFSQSNVTALHIPANVSDIHWGAFAHAEKLATLTVDAANTTYAAKANMIFSKDMKTLIASTLHVPQSVTVPSTVTAIGDYAFIHNKTLKSVHIPPSVRSIGDYAFSNSGVERIYMEDGVETIGKRAFASADIFVGNICYVGGTEVNSIRFSGCLKEIGEGMLFGHLPGMTVVLPESLTRIDVHFIDCCMDIYVPETVTYIAPQQLNYTWNEMVIHGVPGSYAETFAKENGYTFASTVDALTLNQTSLTILEKGQYTLTVDVINGSTASDIEAEIVWTSSDDCVSVNNGVITANDVGNATITASWNGAMGSCEVKVGRLTELGTMNYVGFGDPVVIRTNETRQMGISGLVEFLELVDGEWNTVTNWMDLNQYGAWQVSDPSVAELTTNFHKGGTNAALRGVGPGVSAVTVVFPAGQTASYEWTVAGAQYIDPATCTHVIVTDPAVEATCSRDGLTEGSHCELCGYVALAQQTLPRKTHAMILQTTAAAPLASRYALQVQAVYACGYDMTDAAEVTWTVPAGVRITQQNGNTAQIESDAIGVFSVSVQATGNEEFTAQAVIHSDVTVRTPAALRVIEAEAFMGTAVIDVVVADGVASIGERAFANCCDLALIVLPESVTDIASDAFAGCSGVTIICSEGSAAERYAKEQEIAYVAMPVGE